ncbi:hypothetical protein ILYODFUR_016411 [Ilyodon furcidens]|uniref:Uncharacterized protein n=1 Tax=Ilyodon furcidens TaxID=33524 RepID=A0ABV0U5V9_9TELE
MCVCFCPSLEICSSDSSCLSSDQLPPIINNLMISISMNISEFYSKLYFCRIFTAIFQLFVHDFNSLICVDWFILSLLFYFEIHFLKESGFQSRKRTIRNIRHVLHLFVTSRSSNESAATPSCSDSIP